MKTKKKKEMRCPYCGAKVRLTTAAEVYAGKDVIYGPDEKMYVCSNYGKGCNAYVGTHKGTDIPFGMLADENLRRKRILAHRAMNRVIDAGILGKSSVYKYLADRFGMNQFHIGQSGDYYCDQTISIMNEIYEENLERGRINV